MERIGAHDSFKFLSCAKENAAIDWTFHIDFDSLLAETWEWFWSVLDTSYVLSLLMSQCMFFKGKEDSFVNSS